MPAREASPLDRALARVVAAIPRGRVATYGQVALLAGRAGAARRAGSWLRDLSPSTRLPWHRVVNASGGLSPRDHDVDGAREQRRRLEREGIRFDARGRIHLAEFLWDPFARRRGSRMRSSRPS
jgi:methylated-DNA-protein-cysteine methyltransferase-like protein